LYLLLTAMFQNPERIVHCSSRQRRRLLKVLDTLPR
jgi:hypothetical protein